MIYDKNINAKSFTHSFFKHYPEVRSQYFGFVMGLTEVNVNENTWWRKIKLMSLVSQRGDRTKEIEWKPKISINLTLIPGVVINLVQIIYLDVTECLIVFTTMTIRMRCG